MRDAVGEDDAQSIIGSCEFGPWEFHPKNEADDLDYIKSALFTDSDGIRVGVLYAMRH